MCRHLPYRKGRYASSRKAVRMNNLNSILIEGVLEADPHSLASLDVLRTTFKVRSIRCYKVGEHKQTDELIVPIATKGRLAEVCGEYLKAGRGVRVVGSLAEDNEGLYVAAEHVEFKPQQKEQST